MSTRTRTHYHRDSGYITLVTETIDPDGLLLSDLVKSLNAIQARALADTESTPPIPPDTHTAEWIGPILDISPNDSYDGAYPKVTVQWRRTATQEEIDAYHAANDREIARRRQILEAQLAQLDRDTERPAR